MHKLKSKLMPFDSTPPSYPNSMAIGITHSRLYRQRGVGGKLTSDAVAAVAPSPPPPHSWRDKANWNANTHKLATRALSALTSFDVIHSFSCARARARGRNKMKNLKFYRWSLRNNIEKVHRVTVNSWNDRGVRRRSDFYIHCISGGKSFFSSSRISSVKWYMLGIHERARDCRTEL